jgi:hypothetical protein
MACIFNAMLMGLALRSERFVCATEREATTLVLLLLLLLPVLSR